MNASTLKLFEALRPFYRAGDLVVNNSGWSVVTQPLSFNPALVNVLHWAGIRIRPFGGGQDGFTLSPLEFEAAYPFADMQRDHVNRPLGSFPWWNWPASAVIRSGYNTATRAFSLEVNRYCESGEFLPYVAALQQEGFITALDYTRNNSGFMTPARAACRIFVNKEVFERSFM